MCDEDPRAYWIWLQHALGAGSSKQSRILEGYPSLREFYRAGREAWLLEGYFTQRELGNMSSFSLSDANALLKYCLSIGQNVITPECENYPELLRQIHNPPCALYVKGSLPDFERCPGIAVVGTRKATATGRAAARSFAFELAKRGAVIVSGGALGIDTAAHMGALQAGGLTVCVLGCGIGAAYLAANAGLRETIAAKGALISEYPPQTQASGSNFPIRNRIISGLSLGTLVVEAAAKSGSLITSDFALEQGRDVFAVPADIFSPVSRGVNALIKSGAKPVSSASDVLEEYPERFSEKIFLDVSKTDAMIEEMDSREILPRPKRTKTAPEGVSPDAVRFYGSLSKEPRHISELARDTGIPAARLLSVVTELELAGAVTSHPGRRYSLPR